MANRYSRQAWGDGTGQTLYPGLPNMEQGIIDGSLVDTIADLRTLGTSGLTNGETRNVLGYYTIGDGGGGMFRYNSASSSADNAGTIIAPNAGSGRWLRIHEPGEVRVRWFGAHGDRSNPAQDQAAFSAALAALGTTGVLELGTGEYDVTGGFTPGKKVVIRGSGTSDTVIYHSGDNTCFSSLDDSSLLEQRGWQDFKLIGNTGTSAKGIVCGNSYGAFFERLHIESYAAGSAIELTNTVTWTEGAVFNQVHTWNCMQSFVFSKAGTWLGAESFSDTNMFACMHSSTLSGSVGIDVGAGCRIYASNLFYKSYLEGNNTTGLYLRASALFEDNVYGIYHEISNNALTGVVMTRLDAGAVLRGAGMIFPTNDNSRNSFAAGSDFRLSHMPLAFIERDTEPAIYFTDTSNYSQQWSIGRVVDDGGFNTFRFSRHRGGVEQVLMRFDAADNVVVNTVLALSGAMYLGQLSSTPGFAVHGAKYADISVTPNAERTYSNGAWHRVAYATAATTPTGTWDRGDVIYHTDAVASGFVGRVCVTAGTPGTFKTFGAISA